MSEVPPFDQCRPEPLAEAAPAVICTALPPEVTLAGWETYRPRWEEVTVARARLVVERTGPGRARIVRLLSPDLADYLDPRLAPGREIAYEGQPSS